MVPAGVSEGEWARLTGCLSCHSSTLRQSLVEKAIRLRGKTTEALIACMWEGYKASVKEMLLPMF